MKYFKNYIFFVSLLINFSCGNSEESSVYTEPYLNERGEWQQDARPADTVNLTDANGLKQGKWVVFRQADEKSVTKMNSLDSVGYYKDNKKTGYWKKYSLRGEKVDSVFYEGGIVKLESNKTYTFDPGQ